MPDLTFSLTPAQAQRLADAVGVALGLKEVDGITPRPATEAEVRQFTISSWRAYVQRKERSDQIKALSLQPFDPT